jgi:hypothetical protein
VRERADSLQPPLNNPMIMPPELEEWVKSRIGDERFDYFRDRPLAMVALAAQQARSSGHVPDDILSAWAILISAKQDELTRSRDELVAQLVESPEHQRIRSLIRPR